MPMILDFTKYLQELIFMIEILIDILAHVRFHFNSSKFKILRTNLHTDEDTTVDFINIRCELATDLYKDENYYYIETKFY